MPGPVVIVGALDTKGEEFRFVRDLIRARGLETIVVDFGVMGDPPFEPDISGDEVARAGGSSLAALREGKDKAEAMHVMAAGLAQVVRELYDAGRLGGILGMAGSGGTSIATAAMRELPVGVPKLMVSTVGGGDVSAYVGTKDITMMPSVVDVAGINSISRSIYANAAGGHRRHGGAGAASAGRDANRSSPPACSATPPSASTGRARRWKQAGYEVLVFHATGTGGKTMESLIASGYITANLDITTTELADEVCGGVLQRRARPHDGGGARRASPPCWCPGCVDMCNFWGSGHRAGEIPRPQPLPVEPERHPDAHQRRREPARWAR